MAAPKSIQQKARALEKALERVAKLSQELEEWYAGKTDEDEAMCFFHDYKLDVPWEFDLDETLEELGKVA